MRLLQICNVGQIVGGTAACAWSVMQSLPDFEHTVVFRSSIRGETAWAFADADLLSARTLTGSQLQRIAPDVILLHNTPAGAVPWGRNRPKLSSPVIQYLHSSFSKPAGADRTVACSAYLRKLLPSQVAEVLWQGVPRATANSQEDNERGGAGTLLRVGRLCTPTARKWSDNLPPFYRKLAEQFPQIQWEFVGCPLAQQSGLQQACEGRVKFYPAGWQARQHFWRWQAMLHFQPKLPETFGRTVAEAMRCGCVPIVDAQGGFQEQLTAETGFLCAQPIDFQQALSQLLTAGVWPKMSQAGQEHAEKHFSHGSFRRRLLSLFEQISR